MTLSIGIMLLGEEVISINSSFEGNKKDNWSLKNFFNKKQGRDQSQISINLPPRIVNRSELESKLPNTAEKIQIKTVIFRGDVEFFTVISTSDFHEFSIKDEIEINFIGQELYFYEIEQECFRYTKGLVNSGFLLAYIRPALQEDSEGILFITMHAGKFGKMRFFDHKSNGRSSNQYLGDATTEATTTKKVPLLPYSERFFSIDQIKLKLDIEKGEHFHYGTFYKGVLTVNNYPDITLNTKLHVRTEKEQVSDDFDDFEMEKKIVDIDFIVDEKMPFHGSLQIDNTGTEQTNEWRTLARLQYDNLTRHYDSLSLHLSYALDGSLYSGAGSYFYPEPLGLHRAHSFSISGGVSNVNVDDIIVNLDNDGDGYYFGSQFQLELLATSKFSLDFTTGITHRYTKNRQTRQGITANEREISLTPLNLGLNYSTSKDDFLKGRNFGSYSFYFHIGDSLGSDGDTSFEGFRSDAKSDYNFSRFQASRIQRLFDPTGRWLLYLKADAQYTNDLLVSNEQKAIGGLNSVRGYPEREILGDKGVSTTIELRTPLFNHRTFLPAKDQAEEEIQVQPPETMQFIAFFDHGHVKLNDPLPGENGSVDLSSVGLGLRLSFTDHLRLSLDYGFTLKDMPNEENDKGSGHLVVRYQF